MNTIYQPSKIYTPLTFIINSFVKYISVLVQIDIRIAARTLTDLVVDAANEGREELLYGNNQVTRKMCNTVQGPHCKPITKSRFILTKVCVV